VGGLFEKINFILYNYIINKNCKEPIKNIGANHVLMERRKEKFLIIIYEE